MNADKAENRYPAKSHRRRKRDVRYVSKSSRNERGETGLTAVVVAVTAVVMMARRMKVLRKTYLPARMQAQRRNLPMSNIPAPFVSTKISV